MKSQTARSNGIDGMKAGRAPSNLKREPIVDRNPYSKPSPSMKSGGGKKKSRKM